MVVHSVLSRIVLAVFNLQKPDYFDNFNQWGKQPVRENIRNILAFAYAVTLGHIPQVHEAVEPILSHFADTSIARGARHGTLVTIKTFFLAPVTVLFLARIIIFIKNKIPSGRKLLYMLAAIGVPL